MIALAEDHVLKHGFRQSTPNEENNTINQLKECLSEVHIQMDCNRLKMKTSKTEFIYCGSRQHLTKCAKVSTQVIDNIVVCTTSIKYLSVWLDQSLSFHTHAVKRCVTAMWNIQRLKQNFKFMNTETCKILCACLVTSHFDYTNDLLCWQ